MLLPIKWVSIVNVGDTRLSSSWGRPFLSTSFYSSDRPFPCSLVPAAILMEMNSAGGPDATQATTVAPTIDLTQRHSARPGHTDGLQGPHTLARRYQTLPVFPQFDPYPLTDTTVVTPGSVFKLSPPDDSDPNLPTVASSHKLSSRKGHYAHRAGIATLCFVQRHWIIASTLFVVALVSISIAVGWSLRLSSFQGVQVLDSFLIGEPFWVSVTAEPAILACSSMADICILGQDGRQPDFGRLGFTVYDPRLVLVLYLSRRFCTIDSRLSGRRYLFRRVRASRVLWFISHVLPFRRNLLRGQSGQTANSEKPPPIFTINATDYQAYNASSNPDYRVSSPQFRTEVAMTNFYYGGRSAQSYPFDK